MCLKDLKGELCVKDGFPCLVLGEGTTPEQVDEIISLFGSHVHIDQTGRLIVKHPPGVDVRTMALDLGEEGARIKIDPSVSASLIKRGFIQTHPYAHRHTPTGWELGNHLSIAPL